MKDGTGAPETGSFDFVFELHDHVSNDSQVGPTVMENSVSVTDKLFIVELDFGAVFDGTDLWLEIEVDLTVLSPRQHLTAAPYALFPGSGLDADTLDTLDSLDFATAAALATHVGDSGNPHTVTQEQITPTTSKGDLLVEDGADVASLPVGVEGAVLVADSAQSTGVKWQVGRLTVNACPHLYRLCASGVGAGDGSDDVPGHERYRAGGFMGYSGGSTGQHVPTVYQASQDVSYCICSG